MFLEISQNSQENTCAKVSFLIKVAGLRQLVWATVSDLALAALAFKYQNQQLLEKIHVYLVCLLVQFPNDEWTKH